MQTNIDHIFAAGDVTGVLPLETVAAKQGSLAVMNMYDEGNNVIDYKVVPRVVFTSPAVGSVGIGAQIVRQLKSSKEPRLDADPAGRESLPPAHRPSLKRHPAALNPESPPAARR